MPSEMIYVPEHVKMSIIDGEAVLLNVNTGKYLGCDAIGTRILQLVAEDYDADGIVAVLLTEYEINEERLRADLNEFITDCRARGVLDLRLHASAH